MALIVQKFGGTSVANLERIQHVAHIVQRTREAGHDVVVVVSAMSGETDRLIDLAYSAAEQPNDREYDALVSTGEQVTASLLSMTLISTNCPACSYNAAYGLIRTDNNHRKARILDVDTTVIKQELLSGRVPVVTGFQGINEAGHVTTIGRGGSDFTAVALAAALEAAECQIYTDVDGVYTTDPRVVKDARRLEKISFDEMLELSNLGAKVMQMRAVEFANKHQMPIRVLSSFEEGPGTLITMADSVEDKPLVSGIAFDRNQAKLTLMGVPDQNGVSAVLSELSAKNIEVDMMVQNIPSPKDKIDFSFTVHLTDYKQAFEISKAISTKLGAIEVAGNEQIAKLSVVGLGMKTHASVAAKMMQTLSEEGINIHLITSSEVKISTVIDEKYMELGARILHAAFDLGSKSSN